MAPEIPSPGRKFTALIVDDNLPLRKLNRLILRGMGVFGQMSEADNGKNALLEAEKTKPDLILLDLLMPVMDGFEALPLLRRTCPDARIVVLSMLHQDQAEERVLELGADAFIDKSVDEKQLALSLSEIMAPLWGRDGSSSSGV